MHCLMNVFSVDFSGFLLARLTNHSAEKYKNVTHLIIDEVFLPGYKEIMDQKSLIEEQFNSIFFILAQQHRAKQCVWTHARGRSKNNFVHQHRRNINNHRRRCPLHWCRNGKTAEFQPCLRICVPINYNNFQGMRETTHWSCWTDQKRWWNFY